MGERLLRANILQPSTDLSTITGRQCAVEDLLDNEDIFFSLSTSLAEFPDIDSVITALVRLPEAKTVRQATQVINNVLLVKHVLETSLAIAGSLNGAVQSELLCEIATSLSDLRAGELLAVIHAVVRADIQVEKSAQAIRSQRCHMVKDGVDGFLDVSRSIFDAVSQQVIDLVEQYANELQIPIKAVYRPNIGYIMSCKSDCFSDGVPDEFLNFVRKKSQCTFTTLDLVKLNNRLAIEDGRHPIIESMGDPVTPNRINTAGKTFTIISGPNMGGKSTVPARSATFKIFDKLFVRMNNDDSIAEHESSFVREMRDVSYILHTYNQHSLVLIDELGRSTATQEGMAICRAISEELLESHATVFLTTHFLELPHILGQHRNCSRLVLSDPDAEDGRLQRYRATCGEQPESLYGIKLASRMGFPQDVIDIARKTAGEIGVKHEVWCEVQGTTDSLRSTILS
ncbi:MutS protein msh4 [Linderina pennispora]|nr:MutS protein msh4 [Linderina pennispora]